MKFSQLITSTGLLSALSFAPAALAAPAASASTSTTATPSATGVCAHPKVSAGPISPITHFPNGTWVENLAIRSDGSILAAQYEQIGRVLLVSPTNGSSQIVHTFPNPMSGALGIVEAEPDIFYVLTITRGATITDPPKGTGQVWRFDMSKFHGADLTPTLVTNLTDSILLNGVTITPNLKQLIVGDSQAGLIWRVDPKTGKNNVIASGPTFQNTSASALGVNGLHIKNEHLYFTNTEQQKFGRFPIDCDGQKTGNVEILDSVGLLGADDFDFLGNNSYLLAGDTANKILYVPSDSANCTAVLGSVNGPTALKIVKSKDPKKMDVFVSTDGGIAAYKTGGPVGVAGTISHFELFMN